MGAAERLDDHAYAVIITGGLLITIGCTSPGDVLADAERQAQDPRRHGPLHDGELGLRAVCGANYWRVIAFSPEVLIFLFFMITDPKTVPAGRVGRVVFGLLVAVASTL